jgi:uncharacterized membrane protein
MSKKREPFKLGIFDRKSTKNKYDPLLIKNSSKIPLHLFDYHTATRHEYHPIFRVRLTLGQRAADAIAKFGGSWTFIIILLSLLLAWISINTWLLITRPYDPYPFILLNLILSALAGFQAPIILMAQNRQAERDRVDAHYDHAVNRKAEREIQEVYKELRNIRFHLDNRKR